MILLVFWSHLDIGAHGTFILQVTNGVLVGTWYPFEFCPTGYMATGFRVQVSFSFFLEYRNYYLQESI